MARTAVIAGTATVAVKGVSGMMDGGDDQAAAAPAPAPVAAAPVEEGLSPEDLQMIEQLNQMKASGSITEEEFVIQKNKILNG
jgi:hypothetical protein